MNNIDWNEAPEWATGHGLMNGGFGIEEVWFNAEQYLPLQSQGGYGPYPFGGGIGPHMHNGTRGQIQFQQHRPAPWSGEGLPPVGVECEAHWESTPKDVWHPIKVLAHDEGVVVFRWKGGESKGAYSSYSQPYNFRPLRTPEQIAAEERDKAVSQMAVIALAGDNQLVTKVYLERLYDAGYRRVEQ